MRTWDDVDAWAEAQKRKQEAEEEYIPNDVNKKHFKKSKIKKAIKPWNK